MTTPEEIEYSNRIRKRRETIFDFLKSIRELSLVNIEHKRKHLSTLLLIIFVATTFVVNAEYAIKAWSIFLGITLYLLCAITICVYITILLTKEGRILDQYGKFAKNQDKDLIASIEDKTIHDIRSLDIFESKKREEEIKFKEGKLNSGSDLPFVIINSLFILGTFILLLGYFLEKFKISICF